MDSPIKKPRGRGWGHVFDDLNLKNEMLELRRQGYAFTDLARKYGVDHTTIVYHCRKAGLLRFSDDPVARQQMLAAVAAGEPIDVVAARFGSTPAIVVSWCKRSKMKGHFMGRNALHLFPSLPRKPHKPRIPRPMSQFEMDKMVARTRPGWRLNEKREWVQIPKSYRQIKKDVKDKNKLALEEKRLKMLTY